MKILKNIQQIAKEVLLSEGNAVKNLATLIDQRFEDCVQTIFRSPGRVIVTGIGKSAIIAGKIVATLNSTGTPAIFMHAADAIHGDIGMVQSNDLVICISKSGSSPEIKVLVPLLKRRGAKLIALVSNMNSYLAEQCDYILNATMQQEACPNNLAPTTSTTCQLALGDALAIALLELRNFTAEDFARSHPGGALGKQMYLKVGDLLNRHELPLVKENTLLKDVIIEISSKRLGATAVVNDQKELLGIITDGDLRRMLQKESNIANITAKNIMTKKPKTVAHDEFAAKALQIMQQNNITQLVVTDDTQVIGFVHLHDLLKEGII